MNGVNYSWDANGNILSDGSNTYTYNHANELTGVTGQSYVINYAYNGVGDRLRQNVNSTGTNYTLDLANNLTQVLSDGTNTYLYGAGTIGERQPDGWLYGLGDALGSVRQLVDSNGVIQLSKRYEPYGDMLFSEGSSASSFGFTGEWTDGYIESIYLRSRWYSPRIGRFLTRDSWLGDYAMPLSLNNWNYVEANPVNLVDPSGHFPVWCQYAPSKAFYEACVLAYIS